MAMTVTEKELNPLLKETLENAFDGKEFKNLSNFERRKAVFDYLVENNEYDFNLLNELYTGQKRELADEILSVFGKSNVEEKESRNAKGICNSFSYAYKILLDKLRIPSVLAICEVEEESVEDLNNKGVNTSKLKRTDTGKYRIPHMLVLVQNNDGTFSFDDITYAIFNRGTNKEENYFNYDLQMAKENRQLELQGFDTDMLRFIVENSKDTDADISYRARFAKENQVGFLKLPVDLIKRYKAKTEIDDGEHII